MPPPLVASRQRVSNLFQEFARSGSLSGVLLLLGSGFALAWANSPFHESYVALLARQLSIGPAGFSLDLSLLGWCNDALMAVFFLLVGLEIKRELLTGELASPRQAAFPVAAAIGGMLVPALLYWAMNPTGEASAGWGIPVATDIAFALGILSLLGPAVPVALKVFLTALAIVDDMGAVVVIALFYTEAVHVTPLLVAGGSVAALAILNGAGIRRLSPYLIIGVVLWIAVHESGIHSTIAGVVLALTIPAKDALPRLEQILHRPVHYAIMPLFAVANAGVRFVGGDATLAAPVTVGIATGLIVGKPVGILFFSWLVVRLGIATRPAETSWRVIAGAACLGGIGFTMSLFIAELAFADPDLLRSAKIGIMAASASAALIGAFATSRSLVDDPRRKVALNKRAVAKLAVDVVPPAIDRPAGRGQGTSVTGSNTQDR